MLSASKKIDRVLLRFTLVISIIVAISLPTIYAYSSYNDLSDSLLFKAQIKAGAQSELITTLPSLWMYAENRMQGLLAREPVTMENEYLQIFDFKGEELTSVGKPIEGVSIQRSYPLYDIDQIVGRVTVKASLFHLLINTLISAIVGICLGAVVLLALWFIPIRKLRDISDQLADEKKLAEITLRSIQDGVLRTDKKGDIVYLNLAAEKLIGHSFAMLKGKAISDVITLTDSKTGVKIESVLYDVISTRKAMSRERHCSFISQDNRIIFIEETAVPIFDTKQQLLGAVLCLSDVTLMREELDKRSWEALHDPLTGLMNRRKFKNKIAKAIEQAQTKRISSMICFMDLDHFKIVNDSCGHNAGDDLLVQLSQIISAQVRSKDALARLGGDEFGLLLDRCDLARAQIIAKNILNDIEEFQFFYGNKAYSVGISIGMSSITKGSYTVKDVLSEADSACYWAKESGRHRLCVFQDNMVELTARRNEISWIEQIKSALVEDRFVLYHQTYQALKANNDSRRHLEILLRFVSNQGEIILPGHFFPAAERYNLMFQIDQWVINKTFSVFQHVQEANANHDIMVNINLSGASINTIGLFDFIKDKVEEYGVDTKSICFEVTETVAVRNLHTAIEFINKCKKIGFKFALDDFGTGTSSFSYLKNIPVDYLKIDGSFVRNMAHDEVDKAMVETINRIGHLLGKVTIAEFAENSTIVEILDDLGVDFAQGYGVCKPIPLEKFNLKQKNYNLG